MQTAKKSPPKTYSAGCSGWLLVSLAVLLPVTVPATATGNDQPWAQITAAESSPASRPAWVDTQPQKMGNVYRQVIRSDPFSTLEECCRQLESPLRAAVAQRMDQLAEQDALGSGDDVDVGLDYILEEICRAHFIEQTQHDFGAMQRVHLLLEFTPPVERQLQAMIVNHIRGQRVRGLAGAGIAMLALVGVLYGLLKNQTGNRASMKPVKPEKTAPVSAPRQLTKKPG